MRVAVPSHLRPDPLRLAATDRATQITVVLSLSGIAVGLVLATVPASSLSWGGIVEIEGRPFGPFVAGLWAISLVAMAARLARRATLNTKRERVMAAFLGVSVAALCGDSLRQFLQLAVLREGWRPLAALDDPVRALPTMWMYLAGLVLISGFAVALGALLDCATPRALHRSPRFDRPRRCLHWCSNAVSWVPLALVGLFVIGHLVLGPRLMDALGATFPAAGGFPDPTGPQLVFLGLWPHLSTLAVLQFGLAMWGAVELARLTHEAAPARSHRHHRVWGGLVTVAAAAAFLTALGRAHDDLIEFGVTAVAVTAMVIPLTVIIGLLTLDQSPTETAMAQRGRFQGLFPRSSGDVAIVTPIAIAITCALLWQWGPVVARAIASPLDFPRDALGYRLYWQLAEFTPTYGNISVEEIVRPALVGGAVVAGLNFFDRDGRWSLAAWGFPLFLGLALVVSRLDEVDTFLLIFAMFTLASAAHGWLLDEDGWWWAGPLRVGALAGIAIAYLVTPDLPLTIILAASIALRFGWQAGSLNTVDEGRHQRIRLSLALALLLAGLLLAEQATTAPGFFAGQQFAALGQEVGVAFFAIPIALALGASPAGRRRHHLTGEQSDPRLL